MQATAETKKQKAIERVFDALERSKAPHQEDLREGGLCESCYGFGYHYKDDEHADWDERTNCKDCSGTGERNHSK